MFLVLMMIKNKCLFPLCRLNNMEYTLVRSKRRSLSVTVTRQGELLVRAPLKLSVQEIERFLTQKSVWIERKISVRQSANMQLSVLNDCNEVLIKGVAFAVTEHGEKNVFMDGQTLYIPQNKDRQSVIKRFIKNFGEELLGSILNEQLTSMKRSSHGETDFLTRFNDLQLSDPVRYWGVCRRDGKIRLNYRLVMLPERLIRYVVIHELCHLKHFNHSAAFWRLVAEYDPDFKAHRTELNTYTYVLQFLKSKQNDKL